MVTSQPRASASSVNDIGLETGPRALAHEGAARRRALEQTLGDERVDRLAHGHPRHAEVLHQLALRGCRGALGEILDQVADVLAHLDVLQRRSERHGHLIHGRESRASGRRGRGNPPEPLDRRRNRGCGAGQAADRVAGHLADHSARARTGQVRRDRGQYVEPGGPAGRQHRSQHSDHDGEARKTPSWVQGTAMTSSPWSFTAYIIATPKQTPRTTPSTAPRTAITIDSSVTISRS